MFLHTLSFAQDTIQASDSLKWHQHKFPKALIAPVVLTGVGLSIHQDRGFYSSYEVQQDLNKRYPGFHSNIDDYTRHIPAYATYGLNVIGIRGKSNFLKSCIIYFVSSNVCKFTYRSIKRESNQLRPDSSDFKSMPSGHTAIAFVSATFMHEEFKHRSPWYGVAAYSFAVATGAMRMLNNKHYASDVLIGASLGIATTKLTYLAYPWVEKKLFKKKKSGKSIIYPEADSQYVGIRLLKSF